jgi:hypothetical protein
MHATCPVNVIPLTFINLMVFWEEYNLRAFYLRNCHMMPLLHIPYIQEFSDLEGFFAEI